MMQINEAYITVQRLLQALLQKCMMTFPHACSAVYHVLTMACIHCT